MTTKADQAIRAGELAAEGRLLLHKLRALRLDYDALLGEAAAALAQEREAHAKTAAELAGAMRELFRLAGMS